MGPRPTSVRLALVNFLCQSTTPQSARDLLAAPPPLAQIANPSVQELQGAIETLTARNQSIATLNAGLERELAAVQVR